MTQAIKRLKATAKTKKPVTAAPKKAVALPKDVQAFVADYSELGDSALMDLEKALKTFGIYIQVFDDGSDSVLVSLSKTKLTKAQQKSLFNDE